MPLGAHVRRLRLDRDLSQEELAELAGIHYKHLGRVELGKAEIGVDALVRVARALAVPVGSLFENITPSDGSPARLPVADVEAVAAAMRQLSTAVERLVARPTRPVTARATKRSSR